MDHLLSKDTLETRPRFGVHVGRVPYPVAAERRGDIGPARNSRSASTPASRGGWSARRSRHPRRSTMKARPASSVSSKGGGSEFGLVFFRVALPPEWGAGQALAGAASPPGRWARGRGLRPRSRSFPIRWCEVTHAARLCVASGQSQSEFHPRTWTLTDRAGTLNQSRVGSLLRGGRASRDARRPRMMGSWAVPGRGVVSGRLPFGGHEIGAGPDRRGQAPKGTGGMPRRHQMVGVEGRERSGGAAQRALSPECPPETRGTETSQYPEEEKSTETPSVAASERGRA